MRNVVAAAVLAVVAAFCCRAAQKTDVAREWESSGRPDAMDWFTRNWFGARPVERPADEKVGRDFVSFVGGRKKVRIRLFFRPGLVRLMVSDDGCGFGVGSAPGVGSGHLGLASMRMRAEEIGGRFAVKSEIGRGTSVMVEVPCG